MERETTLLPGAEGKEAKGRGGERGRRVRREGGGSSLAGQRVFLDRACLHCGTFLRTGLDPSRGEVLYLLNV